ncbi:type 1 fimbrial major subunit FimA [Klebsiella pasteurii]|uniref:type 1 fimbrial major subunit FimA n=1 Tax=Klebsiella pasteurii TaxID=2587529 RepID=UPI00237BFEC8|nr:type 1 fimbrial major subunit FimA [Klebsiella pasteurii]MDD9665717.1 type 1 fimbrial major subunit FimA [Klebsiella pasteurii]MDD9671191.1 type 1 fimbrial major subunit FimA [Klebsiella pasteurii]MDD9687308.1 type 1 fimbrial major subunit FimA [Klebsiella pasteurii]
MKIINLRLVVFSALSICSAGALAADPAPVVVNGGTVHFVGEIVNAACAVGGGTTNQTVNLEQVRTAKLSEAGKTSTPIDFKIQLMDCDTTVASKASVSFTGNAINNANPTVLALQGAASGGATNVGIRILDRTGTPVSLDGASYSAASTLNDGTTVIPFQAQYYAIGKATAGVANADATFKIQYQ